MLLSHDVGTDGPFQRLEYANEMHAGPAFTAQANPQARGMPHAATLLQVKDMRNNLSSTDERQGRAGHMSSKRKENSSS